MEIWQNTDLSCLEGEIWEEIKDYEGLYEISNFGRVKRLEKYIQRHIGSCIVPVSYTHLRAHETLRYLVCRLLLEKKK